MRGKMARIAVGAVTISAMVAAGLGSAQAAQVAPAIRMPCGVSPQSSHTGSAGSAESRKLVPECFSL
jgi:hypothetical protein